MKDPVTYIEITKHTYRSNVNLPKKSTYLKGFLVHSYAFPPYIFAACHIIPRDMWFYQTWQVALQQCCHTNYKVKKYSWEITVQQGLQNYMPSMRESRDLPQYRCSANDQVFINLLNKRPIYSRFTTKAVYSNFGGDTKMTRELLPQRNSDTKHQGFFGWSAAQALEKTVQLHHIFNESSTLMAMCQGNQQVHSQQLSDSKSW